MRLLTRRPVLLGFPVLAFLSLTTAAAVKQEAAVKQAALASQREAKAWVKTHETALPTDFEAFAGLPKLYRHYVLAKLPITAQGALWRAHLETFLKSPESLSPVQRQMIRAFGSPLDSAQRAFVLSAISNIDRIFDPRLTIPQRQNLAKPFCDAAKKLFSPTQQALLVGMVGPPEAPKSGAGSLNKAGIGTEVLSAARYVARRFHLKRGALLDCYCNQGSICDCTPYACDGNTLCLVPDVDTYSCGCFHIWECNGTCYYL